MDCPTNTVLICLTAVRMQLQVDFDRHWTFSIRPAKSDLMIITNPNVDGAETCRKFAIL